MEEAIRSFPRIGYRFSIDMDSREAVRLEGRADPEQESIAAARSAAAEQRWEVAVAVYAEADDACALEGPDLDWWALALQCLGRPSDAVSILIRAVSAHKQAGKIDAAAASAIALSSIHLERGEAAVAKGWLARAQDLAASQSESLEAGRICWMQSRIAASEGDPHRALELAEAAYAFGQRRGILDIEALGLMYRGFFRLSLGDTRAGLADQDHAAALALSSKIDPITGGVLYCNILWACRTFGDWARANQWTIGYQQFCAGSRMGFSGSCQLHRAEVLGIGGSLREALVHVNDALSHLSGDAPWAVGDAYRVLGDVRAAMGDTDAALAAYDKAYALGWDPEPGHAMLLLERGEAEAAYVSLERSLIGRSWWTLQRQGMLLAHLALVAAHAGHLERSQALIDDLAGQAERWPMPSIRALTNEASALLAQKRGKREEALRHLHLARQLWTSIESRFNAARLRLQIAALQLDLGDSRGAAAEVRAACAAGQILDSDKLKLACQAMRGLLAELDASPTRIP
jgi:tetratricopeptide (TPR) repeat protein